MTNNARFTKINEGFTCINCQQVVLPTQGDTYRNHCPFCLHSIHVDINPGDRANTCHGLLKPIGLEHCAGGEIALIFECAKCHTKTKNKMALKTKVQKDDFDLAIKISVQNR